MGVVAGIIVLRGWNTVMHLLMVQIFIFSASISILGEMHPDSND
jgi:hypothetical protein